ncbi:hypothetical protein, partial [Serratia marcescens]|uniref:hypothetical protein n=1 Tax=Serratia marcescens TaxID=615 RepID=UPI0028139736
ASQKYEQIKLLPGETINEFDQRFTSVLNELINLGKTFDNREIAMKVVRSLPKEWDTKTMVMRGTMNFKDLALNDLFAELKAYEFEMSVRNDEPTYVNPTHALVAKPRMAPSNSASTSASTSARTSTDISNEKLNSLTEANAKLNEKMETMMALFTERL